MLPDIHPMPCACAKCRPRRHLTRAQRIDRLTARLAFWAAGAALLAIPVRWLAASLPF